MLPRLYSPTHILILLPQPVTEAFEKLTVTATRETARPKKPELKSTAASKQVSGKCKKKSAGSVNTAAATHNTQPGGPHPSPTSTIDEISDLLDHHFLHAGVELTRWVFMSISSPTEAARPITVLKTVILFIVDYVNSPKRTEQCKALRLACSNADGGRGRKIELEHFSKSTVSMFVS